MQRKVISLSLTLMVAILAIYVFIYQIGPFSEALNGFILNMADPLVSLLAAIAVTGVLLCYRKEDKPYPVWLYFAIGLWAWVLAESVWSYIDFTSGALPPTGVPDVLWLIGYGFCTVALRNQYQLVYNIKIAWWKAAAVWLGIVLVVLAGLFILRIEFTIENFANYMYPAVDFALAIAAFRIFIAFGGGKLSRPWIGLFVMGISDFIWAWLNATGQYQASSDAGTWLSVFTDTTYVAAYLILAIGFLLQYLLLRFGPEG